MPRFSVEGRARLWRYPGPAGWHFLTLPPELTATIRAAASARSPWGSVRVRARVGGTQWSTSIFPDKKSGAYLLPVKRQVRDAEGVEAGQAVDYQVTAEG